MRKIKFRGQPKNGIGWVYGYYVYTFEIGYNSQGYDDVPPRKHYIFGDSGDYCEVTPESVGQYAELITWNDIEIYSGDIIKFAIFDYNGNDTHYKGVVKFNEGEWQIWNSWDDEYYGSDGAFSLNWVFHQYDELEVIGNIYEPELLK